MSGVTNKKELLEITEKELEKLKKTISQFPQEKVEIFDEKVGGSLKSIISHRTEWMKMFFIWYQDGIDKKEPQVPAPGYKWNQLKELNAKIWGRDKNKKWEEILHDFEAQSQNLLKFISSQEEEKLYTPKLFNWTNDWTLGRWVEASGSSHFRSANKYLRQILKNLN